MDILRNIVDRTGTDDVIALALIGVSAFLYLTGSEIPESLQSLTIVIVGFFFGKKYTEQAQAKTLEALNPKPGPPAVGIEREV